MTSILVQSKGAMLTKGGKVHYFSPNWLQKREFFVLSIGWTIRSISLTAFLPLTPPRPFLVYFRLTWYCISNSEWGLALNCTFSRVIIFDLPCDAPWVMTSSIVIVPSSGWRCISLALRVMGNGASSLTAGRCSGGKSPPPPRPPAPLSPEVAELRVLVPRLRREVRDWEERAAATEAKVAQLSLQVAAKDEEVLRLLREVHKLRVSVFK